MTPVEEAIAEELLPYKESFTTVVLQQDHEAAAKSLFSCLLQQLILLQKNSFDTIAQEFKMKSIAKEPVIFVFFSANFSFTTLTKK